MAGTLPTANSLPPEAQEILANLNASNEARLLALERRLAAAPAGASRALSGVPPSPAATGDTSLLLNQNSAHSCHSVRSSQKPAPLREQTPSASHSQPGAGSGAAAGAGAAGTEAQSEPPTKRRRTQGGSNASAAAAQVKQDKQHEAKPAGPANSRGASPPSGVAQQRPSLSPFLTDGGQSKQTTPSSKQKQQNTISRYFPQLGGPAADQQGLPAGGGSKRPSPPPYQQQYLLQAAQQEAAALREEAQRLQAELSSTRQDKAQLAATLERLQAETAQRQTQSATRDSEVRGMLTRLAISCAKQEREANTQRLQQLAPRLGRIGVRRQGIEVVQAWEPGSAGKELQQRHDALAEQREAIEAARKAAKRRLPLPGQPLPADRLGAAAGGGGDSSSSGPAAASAVLHPDDWVVQEEIFKARLAALKREEEGLRQERAALEAEQLAYMRDVKKAQDEAGSRFSNFPVLNNRYLLCNLLGSGGFSEVFKALDLKELREVACKIHQLNPSWSEAKKASYVKHSIREYNIHRVLRHPRIVALSDIFEIDNNTFGTVLELCPGGDLDAYLKQHETLPEKEAKTIVAQVLCGLAFMNTKQTYENGQSEQKGSIIHYDLKPANILFTALGEVKLTDFGLSKVVAEGNTQGLELTSQGAGTYWYLPPECFETARGPGGAAPLISNKVDVWSVGVIFYQMLFGRRPFGHDQSQEQILRNEVMLNARDVSFPSKPSVSAECKDFIRACLAYRQQDRLDVAAAAAHPYLSFKKGGTAAAQQQRLQGKPGPAQHAPVKGQCA